MARAIDADAVKFSISGLRYIDPNDYFALAEYFMKQVKAMPTLTLPNEPLTPCDVCRFSPPSSGDGKPCCLCPADCRPPEGEDA